MSKSRVPRLPSGANRAVIQAYVKDVRRYAQVEFKRGASEADVYNSVNQAGTSLPALRSVISREYLTFIGVTDSMLKGVRFFGMLCAFALYALYTSRIRTEAPFFRYMLPALLSVAIFVGVEVVVTNFWKIRRTTKPQ